MKNSTVKISIPRNCFQMPSGFGLLEIVIAVFLIGVMLVASLKTLGAVLRTKNIEAEHKQKNLLARDLLEEILQAPYEDPQGATGVIGIDTGESIISRALFDDVDDYHGWSAYPPQNKDGTPLTNYSGWTRTVSVAFVVPQTHATSLSETDLKLIRVEVTDPNGEMTVLTAFRSRWGTLETEPKKKTTIVTGAATELQIGTQTDQRLKSGNTIVNHVDAN